MRGEADTEARCCISGTSLQQALAHASSPSCVCLVSFSLSLCICATAPVPWAFRFHYPVSGKLQRRYLITGEYHTVSPIAVRKNVDVYVENKRVSLGTERGERAVLAAAQLQLCARLSHSHLPFALVFALAFR